MCMDLCSRPITVGFKLLFRISVHMLSIHPYEILKLSFEVGREACEGSVSQ